MLRWCFLCLNVVVSYFWWSGPIRCKCGWDQHQEHQQQLHGEPTALTQTVGWCIIDPLNIHFSYFFQLQSANKLAPVSAADVQPVFVVFSSICGLFVLSYANLEMFFFSLVACETLIYPTKNVTFGFKDCAVNDLLHGKINNNTIHSIHF